MSNNNQDDIDQVNEHRNTFNLVAFGTTFVPGSKKCHFLTEWKKVPTKEKHIELVNRVNFWDAADGYQDPESGEPISKYEFRRLCGMNFYMVVSLYRLETNILPDGATAEKVAKP